MKLVEVGKIVNTHGIHGDVKVMAWTQSPQELLELSEFYADGVKYTVEKSRIHKGNVLIKFVNIMTADDAELLKNKVLSADKEAFELGENEYFVEDIIGIDVRDADTNESYGTLTDVISTGANDVYELTDDSGKTHLIPAIKDCIVTTDIDNKLMLIRPLEGLFDI